MFWPKFNRWVVSPVVQAALAHAQFEAVHPFIDGNGRTGRALTHLVLRRRGSAANFVPPISLAMTTRSSVTKGRGSCHVRRWGDAVRQRR